MADNHQQTSFSVGLLHPRYWLTWFGFGLLWLLSRLPYRAQLSLGRGLGRLTYHVARRRRSIARRNIELCFPELSPAERERLVRGTIDSAAIALFESGIAWFWSSRRLRRLYTTEGIEHLERAQQQGQGVLLIVMHFTTMDIAGAMLCTEHSIDAVYRPHNNPVYEYLQRLGRERRAPEARTIPRDQVRTIIRNLRSGRAVWYAPDHDYGRRHAEFLPFFGVPAATITTTAQVARMGRAQVIPYVLTRLPGGAGYKIKIHPPLTDIPSGDDVADASRVNAFIEERVREHPEQYMWVHRRFKTRPEGEPSVYE